MASGLSHSIQNKEMQQALLKSIQSIFPVVNQGKKLEISNIRFEDKLDDLDFPQQKEVKLLHKSWNNPILADFDIVDEKTGRSISSAKSVKIGNIPKITNRFTTIIEGNEYQTVNQIRRKSGIYSRIKRNGELESEFNLSKGQNFKMQLEPESQRFVVLFENRKYRLWTLLNTLGVSDTEMRKAWGESLLEINKQGALNTEASEMTSIYKKLYKQEPKDYRQVVEGIYEYFNNNTEVDAETTNLTLGEGFSKANGSAMLAASKKLLDINKGVAKPDERDSLLFKRIYSTDDLLLSYFDKQAPTLKKKLARTLGFKDQVREIVGVSTFDEPIKRFFTVGDLSSTPPQTNPVTIAAEWRKTTPMGTGGIQSSHAITTDARDIQPTHLGFLDALATPECVLPGTQVLTETGWKEVEDITSEDKIACNIDNTLKFEYPERVLSYDYDDKVYGVNNGVVEYLVTKEHRIWHLPYYSQANGFIYKTAEEVFGKKLKLALSTGAYAGNSISEYTLPGTDTKINIEDWAEFIGWYIAEGCIGDYSNKTYLYVSQDRAANPKKWKDLSELLTRLPFTFHHYEKYFFDNLSTELHSYLQTLGKDCYEKHIPEEYLSLSVSARKRLLKGLLAGDGRRVDPRSSKSNNFEFDQDVYTTSSEKLAYDVERLIISLGYAVSHKIYPDNRNESYVDIHEVRIITTNTTVLEKDDYYQEHYTGKVYCLTVPGSLFLTKYGKGRPHWTGNSLKVGVTVGLSSEVKKVGNDLKTPVVDLKGNIHWFSPIEFYNNVVGFPDQRDYANKQLTPRFDMVKAMYKGEAKELPKEQVKYFLRSPRTMFSYQSNLVPFMHSTQGNRAATGARMITQALGIDQKEAPLVQVKRGEHDTYEHVLGAYLNPQIDYDGTVTKLDDNYIHIKTPQGETKKVGLYNNFPLNQDGYLQSIPLVKVGDKVKKGDILADSNYSKDQTLALGKNLNVAYMSYKGYNFEDGAVMTESAAKKMSHTMLHKANVFFSPKLSIFDKSRFNAWFPDEMTPQNNSKLDEKGIIKIGETVEPDDVLCAFLVEKELDDIDQTLKKLDKYTFNNYTKNITRWSEEDSGVVTDVRTVGRNIDIYIKSNHPLKEGDKIAGRYGNKSIITKIIPDSDAPYRPDGEPIDILLSPEGVPGRMNIGQLLETAAAKIADKTGKTYIVNNFDDAEMDSAQQVFNELKKHNIAANETLIDGKTGQKIDTPIFVGKQYILKLRHIVNKKQGVHSFGTYDTDEQPTGKGVQKIGILDAYSYLAHGAKNNLREAAEIKGRKNDEYWRDLQFGLPPGKPNRNFAFEKMITYLKGSGINVEKNGNKLRIFPLTDKEVTNISNGELTDPGAMLIGKNLASRKGGLFDPILAGGVKGTNWTHIDLVQRIPNPMYEDAILKTLNLTENDFNNILYGKKDLEGKTGPEAIIKELENVDVELRIKQLKADLKTAPPTNVNKLNTKLKYAMALKDLKMSPVEAYTMQKLPVIPPQFRTIYPLPSGDLMVSDINKHYRDVGLINQSLKSIHKDLTDKDKIEGQVALYNGVKALQGFTDPITYSKDKYKGFIKELGQMRSGLIQGTVWTKPQDLSGRSTITVEPDLGIDEVGVPFNMAYTMYKPFIIREMKQSGIKVTDAKKYYDDEHDLAKNALRQVIKTRPVILNRAPTLHEHSIQAFRPVLMTGKTIRLNPLIIKGFNADFDGDTMSLMVPVGHEAVEEAKYMMPSKMLFKHGDNQLVPEFTKDYIYGLWELSRKTGDSGKSFTSIAQAKASGIKWTEEFKLNGTPMTIGQYMINSELPTKYKDYNRVLTSKNAEKILTEIAKDSPNNFADIANSWKSLGATYSYIKGHTISITDFVGDKSYRDDLLKKELPAINKLKGEAKINALNKLTLKVQDAQNESLAKSDSYINKMVASGSFNKGDSIRQILSMPGVMQDINGENLEIPILKSYGEGLDTASYWNSLYSVRKGTVDRAVNTQESGALNKSLLHVNRRLLVVQEDCNTDEGLELEITDRNVMDRTLLLTIPGVGRRNAVVDNTLIQNARSAGITKLKVRSPLTCHAVDGVCQKCYGLLPNGQLPAVGNNVGILESQAVTERSTQLTMKCTLDSFTVDQDNKFNILSKCYTQKHAPSVPMMAIYLEDGGCMIVQENHPMWVNGQERYASSIVPGLDTLENRFASIKSIYDATIKDDSIACLPAYTMGCFAGDGSLRYYTKYPEKARAIIITSTRDDIKAKLNYLYPGAVRDEDYQIYNTVLSNKLKEQIRPNSKYKALLLDWSRLSKEWLGNFIAGLIDTDGTIDRTGLKIYSNSFALLDQVRTMALILGIPGTLRLEKRRDIQRTQGYYLKLRDSENIAVWLKNSFKVTNNWKPGKLRMKQTFDKENVLVKRIVYPKVQSDFEVVYDRKTDDKKFITGTYTNHNTFHSGGSALGGGGIAAGFPRIEQLLKVPEKLSGKATLAEKAGVVTEISKNLTGGYNVKISGKNYIIPPGRLPIVSVSQRVEQGDAISDGIIKPQELGDLTTHLEAQRYIVKELGKVYENKFYDKTFETVLRGTSDNAEIIKAPEDTELYRGDKVSMSFLQDLNRKRKKQGLELVDFKPYFKSIDTLNTDNDDWFTRITTNRVKAGLITGASKAQYSNIKGKDPIPAYLYGDNFGRNTDYERGSFY